MLLLLERQLRVGLLFRARLVIYLASSLSRVQYQPCSIVVCLDFTKEQGVVQGVVTGGIGRGNRRGQSGRAGLGLLVSNLPGHTWADPSL